MRLLPALLITSVFLAPLARAGEVPPDATSFRVGNQVTGAINFPGDEDVGAFQVLGGTKLKLTFQVTQGGPIEFSVRDPLGLEVPSSSNVLAVGESATVKFKAEESGAYSLVVRGVDGSTGVYQLTSKGKLPGAAKSKKKNNVKPKGGAAQAAVGFKGLADATLTLKINPKKFGGGAVLVSLVNPLGNEEFSSQASTSSTIVEGLPLPLSGDYEVRLSGYPNGKSSANVEVVLTQPVGDPNTIVVLD